MGGKRSFLRDNYIQNWEKNQKELGKNEAGQRLGQGGKLAKGAASTMALRLREQMDSSISLTSGYKEEEGRDESGEFPGSPVVRLSAPLPRVQVQSKEPRPRHKKKKKKTGEKLEDQAPADLDRTYKFC